MTSWLAALGAASADAFWVPVLAWTALAVVCEVGLRLGRPTAALGLSVRGALLALLPTLIVAPPTLARWVPSVRPGALPPMTGVGLPTVTAITLPTAVPSVSAADVALGLATLAALAASVVAVGVLIGGLVRLLRYRRGLRPAPLAVQSEAEALARQLGIHRSFRVAQAGPGSAPFTAGWRRPVVAVPPDLTGEPLRLALAHELAHVRGAHYGWGLAERVVRALFVWHPLSHLLGRSLALDRERLADASVMRLWPESAQRYGRLLVSVSTRPAPALALGASSSTLITRLAAMTHLRPARRRLARVVGLTLVALPLWLAAAAVPDAQQRPDPQGSTTPGQDSLAAYIESIEVWTSGEEGTRMRVQLKPGTSRATAVRVADLLSDGDEPGALTVVAASGEEITRSTLRRSTVPAPPPPPPPPPPTAPGSPPAPPPPPPAVPQGPPAPPPPAPPVPPAPPSVVVSDGVESISVRGGQQEGGDTESPNVADNIESIEVWKLDGGGTRLEIQMKAGTSRQDAVAVLDTLASGDRPVDATVITASGERIQRSNLPRR